MLRACRALTFFANLRYTLYVSNPPFHVLHLNSRSYGGNAVSSMCYIISRDGAWRWLQSIRLDVTGGYKACWVRLRSWERRLWIYVEFRSTSFVIVRVRGISRSLPLRIQAPPRQPRLLCYPHAFGTISLLYTFSPPKTPKIYSTYILYLLSMTISDSPMHT